MKKKLITTVCLLCLSIPIVVSAASTGDTRRIDDYHHINGTINCSSGYGDAITSWEGHENNCNHGLYAYIDVVDQYGNKLGANDHFNWSAGYDNSSAYTQVYNGSACYFNSRHTTASDSSSLYLELSRY